MPDFDSQNKAESLADIALKKMYVYTLSAILYIYINRIFCLFLLAAFSCSLPCCSEVCVGLLWCSRLESQEQVGIV